MKFTPCMEKLEPLQYKCTIGCEGEAQSMGDVVYFVRSNTSSGLADVVVEVVVVVHDVASMTT